MSIESIKDVTYLEAIERLESKKIKYNEVQPMGGDLSHGRYKPEYYFWFLQNGKIVALLSSTGELKIDKRGLVDINELNKALEEANKNG
jgi:hypothetical protein